MTIRSEKPGREPVGRLLRYDVRLVVADIDGTLLDDNGALPDLNRSALRFCRELDIKVCLATGRRWTTCRRLLDRLSLWEHIDYCILNNGMIVRDIRSGRDLYRKTFPPEMVLEAVAALNLAGLDPVVLTHPEDGSGPDVFHRRDSLCNGDFVRKNAPFARQVSDWSQAINGGPVVELVLVGREGDLGAAEKLLRPLGLETSILKNSFYAEHMLEITPPGVNKSLGSAWLLKRLGLDPGQVMAIGDSGNDLELLRSLPRSVAMANACEPVKRVARHITGTNAEGGFGQAVYGMLGGAGIPSADSAAGPPSSGRRI